MKYLLLLIYPFLFINYSYSQDIPNPSLLWEVSGNGLKESSYLFGSAHLNDQRIFNFGDSVYHALSASKQFAAEIDFNLLDSILIAEFTNSSIFDRKENTTEKEKDSSTFEEMDVNGKPTSIDCYLYRAGMNLGLSSHGLEDTKAQLGLFEEISKKEGPINIGSPFYESFIDIYANRDIDGLQKIIGDDFSSDFEMDKRNRIQAISFEKLSKIDKTFAVVGAAHLIGENSVLDLLEQKGYTIRRIDFGQPTNKIDSIYSLPSKTIWYTINDSLFNLSLLSNTKSKTIPLEGKGSIHLSTEFDKGLMYMSVVLPSNSHTKETFIQTAKSKFFPDTFALKQTFKKDIENNLVYDFQNFSNKNSYKAKIILGERIYSVQMVIGFSRTALDNKNVETYLSGIKINQAKSLEVKEQICEEGAFKYLFPADISFIEKKVEYPSFPDRNKISIKYKSYTDPATDDSYLVKYHDLPIGVTYLDPYFSLQGTIMGLANVYKAKVDQLTFFEQEGKLGADAVLVDSFGTTFYTKNLVRGTMMYLLVQSSSDQKINTNFFENFVLLNIDPKIESRFQYPAANFSISAPEKYFEEDKEDSKSVDFSINEVGLCINLEFKKYDLYPELNLHDSIFSYESIINEGVIDSLIQFKKYKYKNVCPGYIVQFIPDSTFLSKTELGIYCNEHLITTTIVSPLGQKEDQYVKKMIESIQYELDEESVDFFTKRKAPFIIQNLASSDSTVFKSTLIDFNEYKDFTEEDLPAICALLDKDLLKIGKSNAKYDIITVLHDFNSPEMEDILVAHFQTNDNPDVRYRILESLSLKDSKSSKSKLLNLLEKIDSEQLLPEDLYSAFRDSSALLEQNYQKIKALADKGIATDLFLSLLPSELIKDTVYAIIKNDSVWIQTKMEQQMEQYREKVKRDTTLQIDKYLMDYLLTTDSEAEEKLYQTITHSNDIYGKYRVLYNKVAEKRTIPDSLLAEVMKDDYFRYYLMEVYWRYDQTLPAIYSDKKEVAKVLLQNKIYENLDYWCDTCEIIKEVGSDKTPGKNMIYLKCKAEKEKEYYIGCVGSFTEDGTFDFNNDHSVYYDHTKTEEDTETLLIPLINYINEN